MASYTVSNALFGPAQRAGISGCFRRFSRFLALAALATPMAGSRVPLRAARPKPVGRALLTPSRGVGSMALRLGAAREIWAIK